MSNVSETGRDSCVQIEGRSRLADFSCLYETKECLAVFCLCGYEYFIKIKKNDDEKRTEIEFFLRSVGTSEKHGQSSSDQLGIDQCTRNR